MSLLTEKYKNVKIVLASNSPRRQNLLRELGITFEVAASAGIDESWPDGLNEKEIPVYLAEKKSFAFSGIPDDDTLLITADTIVWCNGKVMGKPDGREDAINTLRALSGCRHSVITGVCLRSRQRSVSFSSVTRVCFHSLSDEEITWYVDNCRPYDKAGAYGIQEWIGYIGVKSIKGSYFNVMGLPVDMLYKELLLFV